MAFMVARTEKRKVGSLAGYQIHVDRKTKNHENKDIDPSRTHLNYDLVGHKASTTFKHEFMDYINENKASSRAIRKDAVVMQDWIISSSNDFFENLDESETKQFFEAAVEFFSDKFGAENIRFATVHMDEATPHMHMGIVPMKDGRLTAKTIFDRECLRMIQEELPTHFQSYDFDIERGVKESKTEHINFTEYKNKIEHLQEKVDDLTQKSQDLQQKMREDKETNEKKQREFFYEQWEKDWDLIQDNFPDFHMGSEVLTQIYSETILDNVQQVDVDRNFPREFQLTVKQMFIIIQEKYEAVKEYIKEKWSEINSKRLDLTNDMKDYFESLGALNSKREAQNEMLAELAIDLGVHDSWKETMIQKGGQIGSFSDGREINKAFDELIPELIARASEHQLESLIEKQKKNSYKAEHDRGGLSL